MTERAKWSVIRLDLIREDALARKVRARSERTWHGHSRMCNSETMRTNPPQSGRLRATPCNRVQPHATGCNQKRRPGKRSHGGLGGLPSGGSRFAISPGSLTRGWERREPLHPDGRMRATPCNRVRRGATGCNQTRARAERTHGGAGGFREGVPERDSLWRGTNPPFRKPTDRYPWALPSEQDRAGNEPDEEEMRTPNVEVKCQRVE